MFRKEKRYFIKCTEYLNNIINVVISKNVEVVGVEYNSFLDILNYDSSFLENLLEMLLGYVWQP